jgi:hypothetical protein
VPNRVNIYHFSLTILLSTERSKNSNLFFYCFSHKFLNLILAILVEIARGLVQIFMQYSVIR